MPNSQHVKEFSWLFYSSSGDATTLGFLGHYNAAAGLPVSICESPKDSVLRLGGLRADTVISVTSLGEKSSPDGEDSMPPFLRAWCATIHAGPKESVEKTVSAFISACTAQQFGLVGRTATQMQKDGSAYLHNLLSHNPSVYNSSADFSVGYGVMEVLAAASVGGNPDFFSSVVKIFCPKRSFIITARGRMGIAPLGTSVGDFVSVLFGGGVPYIVREDDGHFLFVGEAYLHGLMSGEAVEEWREGKLQDEVLELM